MKFTRASVRHYGYLLAACAPLSGCFDPLIEDPSANGRGQAITDPNAPGLGTPNVNPGMTALPGVEPGPDVATPPSTTGPTATATASSTVPAGTTPLEPGGASGGTGATGPTGATAGDDSPTGDETNDLSSGLADDAGTRDGGVDALLLDDSTGAYTTTEQLGPTGAQ